MAKYWMAMTCALLLVACTAGAREPTDGGTGMAPPMRIPDPQESILAPQGTAVPTAEMPLEVRRAVTEEAARRFNVASSAVVLTRAEQVTWPDGSLGCPEPGRMYTQMLVSGYRVVAKTTAGELVYHTDSRGKLATCASKLTQPRGVVQPRTTPPPPTPDR